MTLELRPWTPDEDLQVVTAVERAFLADHDPDVEAPLQVLEHDRTLSAWQDGRPVATAAAYSLQMALPGGVRPVAGVTWVSVQPTHRRQGLLRRMMQRQLGELYESGEAVAALWASEPAIYGRFGYGAASRSLALTLRRGDTLRPDVEVSGAAVDEASPADVQDLLRHIWEQAFPQRPGEYSRPSPWWGRVLLDLPSRRDGFRALRCALLRDHTGYALFSTKPEWDERGAAGQVQVRELVGIDGAASLRLWQYLLQLDLAVEWRARHRPLDDVLLSAVSDSRRLAPRVEDALYVRVVRVDEALAARTYAGDLDVVLDVTDEVLPGNTGRWRLTADGAGARCERTRDDAHLALGIEELGAVHLGGTPMLSLAAAGRVRELRPGALTAAARAFRGDVEPLCTHVF